MEDTEHQSTGSTNPFASAIDLVRQHQRLTFALAVGAPLAASLLLVFASQRGVAGLQGNLWVFVLVAFAAQTIDGALGMAYGVSSNTFLLSLGISPAAASASVHTAEVFTTAVSGLSHLGLGNVNAYILKRLVIPGVVGGITGAYLLTSIPADILKPVVSLYLLIMGVVIIAKAYQKSQAKQVTSKLIPLGLIGGFFDAVGGGGWGPIVTTTLVARGNSPRYTIGSVNTSEFFVTFAESVTFILTMGLTNWQITLGLLLGGMTAAPLAAALTRRLPTRALMVMVGILIIVLSIRTIVLALGI